MTIDPTNTIVECPSEKYSPTVTGCLPSCISLRVTLSIAAMWPSEDFATYGAHITKSIGAMVAAYGG
jgi:hypothetical protein